MRRVLTLLVIGAAAVGSIAAGPTDAVSTDIVPTPGVVVPELPFTPFPLGVCARVPLADNDRYCVILDDPR